MELKIYPRIGPPDRLRIWLGAFDVVAAPALTWRLGDRVVAPNVIRNVESVRPANMLEKNSGRAFAGVFEFTGLTPNTAYKVTVESGGVSDTLDTWTLPAQVSTSMTDTFNVLLVSCFHSDEDPHGLAGILVEQLPQSLRPHMTLFMGDQVYLDLPTLRNFPDKLAWLAHDFEEKYTHNWNSPLGLEKILKAAPNVSIPDDHEYWNNFPHSSPFIQNVWTPEGRATWTEAARTLYQGFQQASPVAPGDAIEIDVAPLSFYLADTRTYREENQSRTMTPRALQQLQRWTDRVRQNQLFPVYLTGQSMLDEPAGAVASKVGDRHLSNYRDYPQIVSCLESLVTAGRPLICITGDVHWGRVAEGRLRANGRAAVYEIISSPSSLVSTVGQDQIRNVVDVISGVFGHRDPWPRHSDPEKAPDVFRLGNTVCNFKTIHGQKGNQVTLLSFNAVADSLQLQIRYWSADRRSGIRPPELVSPITLRTVN